MKPTNRAAAQHYTWGEGCDGWHLVKHANLSVIQEQMPAGASEIRHHHRQAQQFFFILSGEAVMEANGEQISLTAGDGLHIPAGTPHRMHNHSGSPVEFLVISQPPSHGDRIVS